MSIEVCVAEVEGLGRAGRQHWLTRSGLPYGLPPRLRRLYNLVPDVRLVR